MLTRKQNGHILIIQRQAKLLLLIHKVIKWHTTYIHPFNDPSSRITQVSQYQKDKTNLDFTEARDSEWQWHQLGHMQVSTSLQTDNHASTPPLSFFTGQMPFPSPNQQHQSTEGKWHTKQWNISYETAVFCCRCWYRFTDGRTGLHALTSPLHWWNITVQLSCLERSTIAKGSVFRHLYLVMARYGRKRKW